MEEVAILEWNIHSMRTKVKYHDFIVNSIKSNGAKIVILVEYKENADFENKLKKMEYKVFTNGPIKGQNEILIALKEELILKNTIPLILTELPINNDEHKPNFLHINFYNKSYKQISIVGIRTRDIPEKSKQLNPLYRYLVELENKNKNISIIVGGDFNVRASYMNSMFSGPISVITPKHNKELYYTPKHINNYSCFITKEDKIQEKVDIDHFLSNNNVVIKNAEYSWNFTKDRNIDVYPEEIMTESEIMGMEWKIAVGYPDHAMLTALVTFGRNY